jgi:hypothetical protein
MKSPDAMKNDKQYSVEISKTPNGGALVKVSVGADIPISNYMSIFNY